MKPPRTTAAIRRSRADAAPADPSRDVPGPERQVALVEGYGVGLTAYHTALLLGHPSTAALRDLFSSDSLGVSTIAEDFTTDLPAAKRRGMLRGPREYVRERTSNNRYRADALRPVMSDQ